MSVIISQVRISISSICYIRDLFPRDCFKNKQYGTVDIHQLQGARKEESGDVMVTHPDAFLLTQWLEQGVFTALEKEYLNTLTFAIYSKHPISGEDLLMETYEFKTTYQGNGSVAKINDVALVSKETVKNQAAKFIRSLTEFTSTLDTLPSSVWITLQLKVNLLLLRTCNFYL
jgi:meiosis-specific protein